MKIPHSSKKEQHCLFLKVSPEHGGLFTRGWLRGHRLIWKTIWIVILKSEVISVERGAEKGS